jgi:hypothetical protein
MGAKRIRCKFGARMAAVFHGSPRKRPRILQSVHGQHRGKSKTNKQRRHERHMLSRSSGTKHDMLDIRCHREINCKALQGHLEACVTGLIGPFTPGPLANATTLKHQGQERCGTAGGFPLMHGSARQNQHHRRLLGWFQGVNRYGEALRRSSMNHRRTRPQQLVREVGGVTAGERLVRKACHGDDEK